MASDTLRTDLVEAFTRFDSDGNGAIDKQEFNALLDALGSSMSAKDRELGFGMIDKDDDGAIALDELAAWWEIVREEGQS